MSAANGDLLLAPIRRELAAHLPFPPRIEVSILGDAAVLTGALAIGLTAASSTRSHSAHKLLAWGG